MGRLRQHQHTYEHIRILTMPQDLPPTGGYEPVQYKRNLPARGFRPSVMLVAMAGVMTFGFYKVGKGIREQNELTREKMWSRIHLIPLLTAEEDRDLVRRHYADQAREKALLGSQTSPYNSDRYVFFSLVPEGELRSGLVDWRRWGWRWSWN